MHTSIEFHDSNVSAFDIQNKSLFIELRPAYVHKWEMVKGKWIGTGNVQNARIRIDNISVPQKHPQIPLQISDGVITSESTTFNNLVPVPFNVTGPIRMVLNFSDGTALEVFGGAFSIELLGDSKFVENLPQEWAPKTTI